ncbi:hypothetical protein AA0616_3110 [Komagataeibacter nataicola NRIC 0616]|nr:hypothetical protein AA0616_3110 [Komagataeibacter nataicola NRIC 0616]
MGRVFGRCVQRALDDLRKLRVRHRAGPDGTIFVGQAFNAIFDKPPPPFADGVLMYPQACSNFLALQAFGAEQNHPAAIRQ